MDMAQSTLAYRKLGPACRTQTNKQVFVYRVATSFVPATNTMALFITRLSDMFTIAVAIKIGDITQNLLTFPT